MLSPSNVIYLASPYSVGNASPAELEQRFEAACAAVGHLMLEGEVVYSPIVHCHPIAVRYSLPRDWEFWHKFDREMLRGAHELRILKLPGWEESKGIAAEKQIAFEFYLPITYMDPV